MYRQQPYGWGDAITQITNAVMQRNKERGEKKDFVNMLGDASKFGSDLGNLDFGGQTKTEDLSSRANGGNYTGANIDKQTTQGLLPTGFQTPNAGMIGQGLLGQAPQRMPTPQQSPDLNIANPMDKYSQANNPVNITTSAPKTLAQQKAMMMGQIPVKLKEYMAQNKNANPKDLYAMYKQQVDNKFAEQEETNKTEMWNQFNDPNLDIRQKLQLGIKMGLKPAEMKMLTQRLTNPTIRNMGDRDQPVAFDPYTGQYMNTMTGQPLTAEELQHGVSPTAVYNKETVGADTKYRIENRPPPRGRNTTAKPSKEESWALGYESGNGLTNDTALIEGLSALDNPTASQKIQLDKALGRRDHYWKVSSGGQYGAEQPQSQQQEQSNPGGAEWYYKQAEEIKANNPGATMEEIEAFMSEKINRR